MPLNSRLENILRTRGVQQRTIDIINSSDEAVKNLNDFSASCHLDSLSEAEALSRIRGVPGGGTFANKDAGGIPYIQIDTTAAALVSGGRAIGWM